MLQFFESLLYGFFITLLESIKFLASLWIGEPCSLESCPALGDLYRALFSAAQNCLKFNPFLEVCMKCDHEVSLKRTEALRFSVCLWELVRRVRRGKLSKSR